jgi:hypothetical protein
VNHPLPLALMRQHNRASWSPVPRPSVAVIASATTRAAVQRSLTTGDVAKITGGIRWR